MIIYTMYKYKGFSIEREVYESRDTYFTIPVVIIKKVNVPTIDNTISHTPILPACINFSPAERIILLVSFSLFPDFRRSIPAERIEYIYQMIKVIIIIYSVIIAIKKGVVIIIFT